MAINDLSTRVSALAEEAKKLEREQKILESLNYESMNQRHSDIKKAYKETLRWTFDNPEIRLLDWLSSGDGIYWISGKAGSGKSTVMKYICDHERTLEALRTWAGPNTLVTASYFFWNAGLPMQKSQKGLLQSLLYQVLQSCPDLINEVCADHHILEPWSPTELLDILLGILERSADQKVLPARFCFFIDGLDEYDGHGAEINRFLQKLIDSKKSKSIKLICSQKNELFRNLRKADRRCDSLVPQIAEKAQGVWLWVYLVVRDLLRDLDSDEGYPLLQRRLNEFPPELEEYFRATLRRIDPIYRKETAQIFLITVDAVRPVPVYALMFLDSERQDPEYVLKKDIKPVTRAEADDTCKTWRNRLNNRCKDLLEVKVNTDSDFSGGVHFLRYKVDFLHRTVRDFLRDNYQSELREETGPEFSARFSLCKMLLALVKAAPASNFLDSLNLLFGQVDEFMYYAREFDRYHRALLRTEQHAFLGDSALGSMNPHRHGGLKNSPLSDSNLRIQHCNALLDELDRVNSAHTRELHNHWTNARDPPTETKEPFKEYGQYTFLSLAIQANLQLYVTEKLNSNPKLLQDKRGRPLLDYALRPKRVTPADLMYQVQREDASMDVKMVSLLLGKGADPNQIIHIYDGRSVWDIFLLSCYQNSEQASPRLKDAWYKAMELLIEHGGNPKIRCKAPANRGARRSETNAKKWNNESSESKFFTVPEILQRIFTSKNTTRLEQKMAEVSASTQWVIWKWIGWT
ncbi:hypothetical protein K440DRAFT_639383 [Wilcoxina mikolae CBS 423.85]|nr:hypothetical protein K440DRAFT_639383 [Wilcoxina mikolae CBS 423.85]